MGQIQTDGHIVLRFIGGIAEHHALVASALFVFIAVVYTAVYIGALLMNGAQNTARIAVELILGLGIADALDGVAGNGLEVDVYFAAHLTHDDNLSGCHKRFDGATGFVVVSQKLV